MKSNNSPRRSARALWVLCATGLGALTLGANLLAAPKRAPVDFDRDVRPILADNCFACHGFDDKKRVAGLRLDTPEGAYAALESGNTAIVPGKPGASALVGRITGRIGRTMPPDGSGKSLTPAQIDTLTRWVQQGAKYQRHWAFITPQQPKLPQLRDQKWPINAIDHFILARLEKEGIRPSPVTDRRTLIRRLSFDLTGLPPTLAEVTAFLSDRKPGAYERLVDRLLASPHYGERMALGWLDTARYADTHGYHIDSGRAMWLWRDWVIRAYNENKPFDVFTIEQLAGDLLPNPTTAQLVATGFNRNHPINYEGGAIPEEYQTAYVLDRVDTTATTWMGLTIRCGQCHTHKYDPVTDKDFYRFFAYFNNIDENGLDGRAGNAKPLIKVPSAEQQEQMTAYNAKIVSLEAALKERATAAAPAQGRWEQTAASTLVAGGSLAVGLVAHYDFEQSKNAEVIDATGNQPVGKLVGKVERVAGKSGLALKLDGKTYATLGHKLDFERTDKFSFGAWVRPVDNHGAIISRMDDADKFRGWDLYLSGAKIFVHIIHEWEDNAIRVNTKKSIPLNKWSHVFATYDGSSKAKGVKIYVDGKSEALDVTHNKLSATIKTKKPAHLGRRNPGAVFQGSIDEVRVYNRALSADDVTHLMGYDSVRPILATPVERRTKQQRAALAGYYLQRHDEQYRGLSDELTTWTTKRTALDKAIPTTMVMKERKELRPTHLLVRGQYDKKGERVYPAPPEFLLALPKDAPQNRLTLAKWLVDARHPLTARVAVNRFWQMYFGIGLVKTPEDFGTQGERPSHPQLLDWLATDFISSGWDVKRLQRLIVTSATYRQSSRARPELIDKDPENRLLARAPRYRLTAEFIRDQALRVSGLLVPKIGGPSVKPYQPSGLWAELSISGGGGGFSEQKYVQDTGEKLYRRSMYTFWKRTVPPPSMLAFDAPEREFCMVRRGISNTPLQALVLMNDPTYVEAARTFAQRIMTEVAAMPKDRIRYAFRLALSRQPNNEEIRLLMELYRERLAAYEKDPESAKKLIAVGESKPKAGLDPAKLAAWTTISSVIFNLDEMISRS